MGGSSSAPEPRPVIRSPRARAGRRLPGLEAQAVVAGGLHRMTGDGCSERSSGHGRMTRTSLKRPAQTISTHVLPAVWERHDPAAARSQNEALHADAHVALQALPQNHAQMRRSNAGTGRAGRNT